MSDNENSPAPLSTAEVRAFIHDLRNSLYVLRLGLGMLADVRGDAARFTDLLAKLEAEELTATQRLEAFSQSSRRALEA